MAERSAVTHRLGVLIEEAAECTRCPTMAGRSRVLGARNGSPFARCLVVAEAPGRLGASLTGVPLRGDRTGDNFDSLLEGAGIDRADLFITNAVLCTPKERTQRSRPPSKAEVARCTYFLRNLIFVIGPAIVVTLGSTALAATEAIEGHGLLLKWNAGSVHRWYGRFLLPLYHPGARAMIQRSLAEQQRDYAEWGALLRSAKEAPRTREAE
ncbi:MAG: uracil-DNA glycosylase [Myxococcota bacterium]